MTTPRLSKIEFETKPVYYIEKTIRDYLAESPNNRFRHFPADPIWEDAVIGYASGDDPLFGEYKKIIGDFHVTPREAVNMYIDSTAWGDAEKLPHVSVISFALTAALKTRESNRKESVICSQRWNHTRFEGQESVARLTRHLVTFLEDMGYIAIAPEQAKWWDIKMTPEGMSSRWSQRHIAYAAGLGTFSLNDGFITPKGMAVRIGSLVCDLELPASPRPYADHYANCLYHSQGTCLKCVERCPAGAISTRGHDKTKCGTYLNQMKEIARQQDRLDGYIGKAYLGCGFCQTGVPCESKIPVKKN
jgi:epoxyqueuosine reductase